MIIAPSSGRARLGVHLAILALLSCAGMVQAKVARASAHLTIDPSSQPASVGDIVDVTVVVPVVGSPFDTYEIFIDYDPALLEYVSESLPIDITSHCGPAPFHVTSATPGHLDLTTSILCGASNPITGPTPLQRVRFRVLAPGSHAITLASVLVYRAGSAVPTTGLPATATIVVGGSLPVATTTLLASVPNPSSFTQPVIFTATVQVGGSTASGASGTMLFVDNATTIATVPVVSGIATLTTSTLAIGSHPMTAAYLGNATYAASTSANLDQVVTIAVTGVDLVSNLNPSTVGQNVTFTASVQVGGVTQPLATGTMEFFDGAASLGTSPVASGQATFPISIFAIGVHPITAVYSGDAFFATGSSNLVNQAVNAAPPTITTTHLTSDNNPSILNELVTLTASVQVGGVTQPSAAGTMQFYDGVNLIWTTPVVSGVATLSTSALAVGSHTISAVYSGDASFTGSTSNAVLQVVDRIPTTVQLVSSNNPSILGESVTFTASVQVANVTQGAVGTMQFYDGATLLASLPVGSGTSALTLSTLGVGSHSITAVYSGDKVYAPSTSSAIIQVVNNPPLVTTSTLLASNLNPSTVGQNVQFTASVRVGGVTQSGAGGTMQFLDGASVIATSSVISGVATHSTSGLAQGTHPITAVYSGDATFTGSTSNQVDQIVNAAPPAATTTLLQSSLNPSNLGQNVTFTASVRIGGVTQTGASGTMQFKDGANVIATMSVVSGVATFSTTALTVGTHTITAVYSGDASFATSTSAPVSQVVNPAPPTPTTTLLSSDLNPSTFGQNVTFTACVQVGGVTQTGATGTIQFLNGASVIATMSLVNGCASHSTIALPPGNHPITAVYSGDVLHAASTSNVVQQVVNPAPPTPTTTALASSQNPSTLGQNVMFTAEVKVGGVTQTTATGTMQFKDGASVIATMPVVSGVSTFSTIALTLGPHSITAVYSGDASFAASTSNLVIQQVNPVPPTATTTLLGSDINPSVAGQNVTFTALVRVGGVLQPTATGTMQFLDGVNVIATMPVVNGVAAFATTALSVGSHSMTAVYSGDASFAPSTSNLLIQVVNPPGPIATTTLLESSLNPSSFGQVVTFTATVKVGGVTQISATGTVQFYDGAAVIGNSPVASGVATLPISTLSAGSHTITAIYSGNATYIGSLSNPVIQVVNPAGPTATTTQLASSVNPSVLGQNVTFTATVKVGSSTATGALGTMQFRNGATVIATVLVSNGVAAFSTTALPVGTHPITAVYSGDPSFAGSTSNLVNQVVNAGTACANLVANFSFEGGNLSGWDEYHDAHLFPVHLGPGLAPHGEWVVQIASDGKDDELFGIDDSPTVVRSTVAGRIYRFSAWVREAFPGSAPGRAALQIREYRNGDDDDKVQTVLAPRVPFTSTFQQLTVDVTALLSGSELKLQVVDDPVDDGEIFQVDNVTITPINFCGPEPHLTALDVTSSLNPSQNPVVTFTAVVKVNGTCATGATGVVQFMNADVPIGALQPLTAGTASITTAPLIAGRHAITAVYSGDPDHTGSVSPVLAQYVRSGGSGGRRIIPVEGEEVLRFEASLAPNPIRGDGLLNFATTRPGPLRVGLFDIAGRQARVLKDEPYALPGRHHVRIDARAALPPGLYFYRIDAAEGTLRGRLVLMR